MKTLFKIIAWIVGIGLVALVAAVVLIPLLVDPNDHKDVLAAQVKQHTGRDLTIDGDLAMSVFPWLGVKVGGVQLGNAPGFSAPVFAKAAGLEVRVKLEPLVFEQRLEIDKVTIQGLELYGERNAEGETNFPKSTADKMSTDKDSEGEQSAGRADDADHDSIALTGFALNGVVMTDAKIAWRDALSGQNVVLSKVALNIGAVSLNEPVAIDVSAVVAVAKPTIDGTVAINTLLHHTVDGRQIHANGLSISADLTGPTLPSGKLKAEITTDVSLDAAASTAKLAALSVKLAQLMQIDGGLTIAELAQAPKATGKISIARFNPRELLKALGQDAPVTADAGALTALSLNADLFADATQVRLAPVNIMLDDSTVNGTFALRDFAQQALSFDLKVDAVDADRYLPPKAAAQDAPAADASASSGQSAGVNKNSGETAIALEPLRALNVNGKLAVGQLKINHLKLSDISVALKAKGGNINLKPLSAKLYGGSYAGNVGIDARGKALKLRVNESLNGVQLEPLLKTLQNQDQLSGTATMQLTAATTGATVAAMKQGLNGKGRFLFENGAVKGYNLGAMIREARANFLGDKADTSDAPKRTDFSEMGGSFSMTNGVIDNRDFIAKIPLLRVTGKGKANLVNETIDYLATVSVVATSKGQGGKGLADLKGIAIPVNIGGTFSNPTYGFEGAIEAVMKTFLSGKVKDLVKGKIDDVGSKVIGGAVGDTVGKVLGGDGGGDAAKSVSGALGGLLKGGGGGDEGTKQDSSSAPPKDKLPASDPTKLLKGLLN